MTLNIKLILILKNHFFCIICASCSAKHWNRHNTMQQWQSKQALCNATMVWYFHGMVISCFSLGNWRFLQQVQIKCILNLLKSLKWPENIYLGALLSRGLRWNTLNWIIFSSLHDFNTNFIVINLSGLKNPKLDKPKINSKWIRL